MIHTYKEKVRQEIRVQLNDLADALANNSVRDIEDYRFTTGQIHGLIAAERILMDAFDAAMGETGDE